MLSLKSFLKRGENFQRGGGGACAFEVELPQQGRGAKIGWS